MYVTLNDRKISKYIYSMQIRDKRIVKHLSTIVSVDIEIDCVTALASIAIFDIFNTFKLFEIAHADRIAVGIL